MIEAGGEEARYRALLGIDPRAQGAVEALVRGLYDDSWRVRKAATEQLAQVSDRSSLIDRLLGVLADRGQTGARNAAAEALARLGAASVPKLIRLLAHSDPDQRKFAADILAEIRSGEAVPALVTAVSDPDPNVRVSATEALGRIGGDSAVEVLEGALQSEDRLLRLAALEALTALRRPPPLPLLATLSADSSLRVGVFQALGLVADRAATELIGQGLASESRLESEAAIAALGVQMDSADAPDRAQIAQAIRRALHRCQDARARLTRALGSEDLAIRRGALWVAGVMEDAELAEAVAEAAADERLLEASVRTLRWLGAAGARVLLRKMASLSAPARAAAGETLVEVADPSLVPDLARLAESEEAEMRVPALEALGKAQSRDALEPLATLLQDPEHQQPAARALVELARSWGDAVKGRLEEAVKAAPTPGAVWALARVAGAEALAVLRRTLRDPDPRVRAVSAEALGGIGAPEAVELLRLALADEAAQVRGAAVSAIGRLALPGEEKLVHAALSDEDGSVRGRAAEAAAEGGYRALAPELAPLVSDLDGRVAAAASRALAQLGAFTRELATRAVRHADPEAVKCALSAAATLPEAPELALSQLAHGRWDVRAAAARVLATSGGRECRAAVDRAAVRETDPLARAALLDAARALSQR